MAYSLSPWLKPRFFITGTNRPLAGGLMYTYKAGTTTPATTYSNDTGTTNTNPIVLDSDGQCDLYLDDAVSYRIILKNSAGVTQFDKDRIASLGSTQVQSFNSIAALRLRSGTTQANAAKTLGSVSAGDGLGNEFYWDSTSSAADDGKLVVKPTAVSGAGRWLALNSAQIMTEGKTAKMMVGVARNSGSGWGYITDTDHAPIRFTGSPSIIAAPEDFKLLVTHTTGCEKVGSLIAAVDETFATYGMIVGSSVGVDSSALRASLPLRFRTYGTTTIGDAHPLFGSRVSISALANGTGFVATVPQLYVGGTSKPIMATTHYIDGRAGDVQVTALTDTTFNVVAVCDLDMYIAYNTVTTNWDITTDNVLGTLTAVWNGTDTLTVTHTSTGRANLGVTFTQIYGGHRPIIVSTSANTVVIKFVNDAGTLQTSLSSAFKFRLSRNHKMPCLMMATQTCYIDCGRAHLYWGDVVSANGNIWMMGMMHS